MTPGALTTTAGAMLIGFVVGLLGKALTRQHVDPTLMRHLANIPTVAPNVVLVVAILGYFGVETPSFAALVAGVGVAARAFLVVLRPFKVGDYVKAGGIEGTVNELGLFATCITTPDDVSTLVGNNSVFADTIQAGYPVPETHCRFHQSA